MVKTRKHVNANSKLMTAKTTRETLSYCVYKILLGSKETKELKDPALLIALTPLPPYLLKCWKTFGINEGVR